MRTSQRVLFEMEERGNEGETYFQGAMTKTTPMGVRLIQRLKPGLSVSAKDTSARLVAAMSSMYVARSSVPRISPGLCAIGLGRNIVYSVPHDDHGYRTGA